MTYHFQNPSQETIFAYLKETQTIAIVGLSNRIDTAAYMVVQVLLKAGYEVLPVNPRLAGQEVLGQKAYASLQDLPKPVDIVNVFRRSEFLADVAKDFLDIDAKVFWAQLGLESQEAEELLRAAGHNDIVMNKCIKIEYQLMQEQN